MKKSKLSDYFLSAFSSEIKTVALKELKKDVLQFQSKHEEKELADFVNELNTNYPQVDIFHRYFIRIKLSRIESHLRMIKIIIVIMFVCAVIGALGILFSSGV